MIRGMHALFYTDQADSLRAFFRDKLGFDHFDAGDGWLIFRQSDADLGVHPTSPGSAPSGAAQISFFCDDIHATVAELREKGVEFDHDVEDHGYGWVTHFRVPGGFSVQLYQPRYTR